LIKGRPFLSLETVFNLGFKNLLFYVIINITLREDVTGQKANRVTYRNI